LYKKAIPKEATKNGKPGRDIKSRGHRGRMAMASSWESESPWFDPRQLQADPGLPKTTKKFPAKRSVPLTKKKFARRTIKD